MKSCLKVLLLICALSIFLTSNIVSVSAQDYDRMLYDDGGNMSGGSTTPVSEQIKDKQDNSIKKVFESIFKGNTSGIPKPSPLAPTQPINQPTTTPTNGSNPQPSPGYTPILEPNSDEARFADQITAAFKNYCGGVVTLNNYSCVDNLSTLVGAQSVLQMKIEMDALGKKVHYLQCVNCARFMARVRNRPYTFVGNAKAHIPKLQQGQTIANNTENYTYYSNVPQNYNYLVPGSIGISSQGAAGHIYYITEVMRDDSGNPTDFRAFECNYGTSGSVRHDIIRSVRSSELAGWQKPNSL